MTESSFSATQTENWSHSLTLSQPYARSVASTLLSLLESIQLSFVAVLQSCFYLNGFHLTKSQVQVFPQRHKEGEKYERTIWRRSDFDLPASTIDVVSGCDVLSLESLLKYTWVLTSWIKRFPCIFHSFYPHYFLMQPVKVVSGPACCVSLTWC